MPYRTVIVALIGLALHPLIASAQNACSMQVVPTEPSVMLACSNAAPVCITDTNGLHGHWAWMCPGNSNTGPKFLDPSVITNSVPAPSPGDSILDTVQRIYQLRQLQLKNQQIQEQNQRLEEERRKAGEQASPMLSLRNMLTAPLFEHLGLNKLSSEELSDLDRWLTVYTRELVRLTQVKDNQEASAK
jgi:hypothetical protein